MKETIAARIEWLSESEGGRVYPPSGPSYCTVARFEDESDWPEEAWSILAIFRGAVDEGSVNLADIRFLFPENAPNELLKKGVRFELMEGTRAVAKVEVLG